MQAYGGDRVRLDGGRIWLTSRLDKGWVPRTEPTGTHTAFPGTAVLWDEAFYEVVAVKRMEGNAVRYLLEPWREENVMRVSERYDEATEAERRAAHQAELARQARRRGVTAFGFVVGHAPAAQQERIASDLGVNASRLTLVSTLPVFAAALLAIGIHVQRITSNDASPIPAWLWFALGILVFESFIRINVSFLQGRPMGSLLGVFGYIFYYYVLARDRSALAPPFDPPGKGLYKTEAPPEVAAEDAVTMAGPYLTLLSPAEQARIAERYPVYDYRQHANGVAWILLVFAACGVISSMMTLHTHPRFSALLSLVAAAYVVVEQVVRLTTLPRRPIGSALAVLVRPFARKFLGG